MRRVYLVQFPHIEWGVVLPYSIASLHSFAIQSEKIRNEYTFAPYIWDPRPGMEACLEKIDNPFLVGISLYLWNFRRSLKLARIVKTKFPLAKILVGGPSLPDDYSTFMREFPYIDFGIHKEGEFSFKLLLEELLNESPDLSLIPSLSYRSKGKPIKSAQSSTLVKPISYPSPYRIGLFDSVYKELRSSDSVMGILETNRGCPFSCTFCDWGSYTNQKVRPFARERVTDDIREIVAKCDEVYVADANFGIQSRDVEIAEEVASLVKGGEQARLHTARVFYAKNSNERVVRIAKILDEARLSRGGVSISLQSTNPHELDLVKRQNIKTERLLDLKDRFFDAGITTFTELIIGLPGQTKDSFLNSLNDAIEFGFNDITMFSLVRIPNAEMFRATAELEASFSPFPLVPGKKEDEVEFADVIKSTALISVEEMKEIRRIKNLVEVLQIRRWSSYIAKFYSFYFNKRIIDFYKDIHDHFSLSESSTIDKIMRSGFLRESNSGRMDSYVGPGRPGNIHWEKVFFSPSIFNWISLYECQDEFYEELGGFLIEADISAALVKDLLRFQQSMMIHGSYDGQKGKIENFEYDWLSFFKDPQELPEKRACELHFRTREVGRRKYFLDPQDELNLYRIAGGQDKILDQSNCFLHDESLIEKKYIEEERA